jgi:hypothetical protein
VSFIFLAQPGKRPVELYSGYFVVFVVGALTLAGCGKQEQALPTRLSSTLPYDVDVQKVQQLDAQGKIVEAQREFDTLAWQTFIALNWPADASGAPDDSKTIADTASPRVWQSWRLASTIFLPDGQKPEPWGSTGTARETPVLDRTKAAWRQNTTSADENLQAFSGPLIDQNGKWARYEVLVDREEFDYIVNNGLYSLEGQEAFSRRAGKLSNGQNANQIDFPVNQGATRHGATEIKLAWKELGPNDDRSRFFTKRVKIKPVENTPQPEREIDAGLVGMHIATRTQSSPEWIWATFEQVDNAPKSNDPGGHTRRYNFFNPAGAGKVNDLPAPNEVRPDGTRIWFESRNTKPIQVERLVVPLQGQLNPLDEAISQSTREFNGTVQALLKNANSVFQYYELIGTQWPVRPDAPAVPGGANSAPDSIRNKTPGDVVPVFLVNTTMETYFQKGMQTAGGLEQDDRLDSKAPPIDSTMVTGTESCVGCHYSAGACIGFKKNADGSYQLDSSGYRTPIYGENGNFGRTGGAMYSWLLQIEAKGKPYKASQ